MAYKKPIQESLYMLTKTKYCFKYHKGLVHVCEDINICLWICSDIPVWHFRIYNSKDYTTSTKMARVMFSSPTIMNLMEPCIWNDIDKDLDLVKLDKVIEEHWCDLIEKYNLESNGYICDPIPKNLKKPDYTKLTLTNETWEYYFGPYGNNLRRNEVPIFTF